MKKIKFKQFLGILLLIITTSIVSIHGEVKSETRYDIPISDIQPTQASVGKAQIAAKILGYLDETQTSLTEDYFKDFNDDNGYSKGNYLVNGQALKDKTLYSSASIRQSIPNAEVLGGNLPKVPVILGPNGKLYATDGHHGSTTYLYIFNQYGLGSDQINVEVIADYSSLTTEAFYQTLINNNQFFSKAFNVNSGKYEAFDLSKIATSMIPSQFANDPFRSLAYFWRKSAIDKDLVSVNFAEFYLGEFLTETGEFQKLSFETADDYIAAFNKGNEILEKLINGDTVYTNLFDQVITQKYHISSAELGVQSAFDASKTAAQKEKLVNSLSLLFNLPSLLASNTELFPVTEVIDTANLTAAIADFQRLNSTIYNEQSYQSVANLIVQAQSLLNDSTATQASIDELTTKIQEAMAALSLAQVPLNTAQFSILAAQFEQLIQENYDSASYQEIVELISKIKSWIQQQGTQEGLDQMTEQLSNKINNLKIITPKSTIENAQSIEKSNDNVKIPSENTSDSPPKLPITGSTAQNSIFTSLGILLITGVLSLTYFKNKEMR
ncbi:MULTISPECIES: ParB-like protein [unclassified Enterococcus]|uniref:ParB-like protein n=1 Tax=unclassified Enterococcus TaxID=2608891 RepID=UPI0015521781|nr:MULTISPECIES: ParB-like protein [unclassified Enterococcus]MBS7578011.1 LPXTG cell wall anchor domain-containing protein [Enterococcus sp. MMGLQ5-2]MBS7585299.1 LPXTG cell wall anchor domain-containing protein [Enterococcus sp. MMGLQ5-1]NPD13156.1 LPXTG cell wall anchor domain-containing protein [Enterococcus sp. MMGLQ5-1]NPD37842.1 LPXTG cell wall anchor domain-containing protein [Enterococcus sp. MMGLQ5-2]